MRDAENMVGWASCQSGSSTPTSGYEIAIHSGVPTSDGGRDVSSVIGIHMNLTFSIPWHPHTAVTSHLAGASVLAPTHNSTRSSVESAVARADRRKQSAGP